MRYVNRNEPCPERTPANKMLHAVDRHMVCIYCHVKTVDLYDESPVVRLAPPIPEVRLVAVVPPCENCINLLTADEWKRYREGPRLCDDCILARRVQFQRLRYEAGDLNESAPATPIVPGPVEHRGHGSLDDWSADTIERAVKAQ